VPNSGKSYTWQKIQEYLREENENTKKVLNGRTLSFDSISSDDIRLAVTNQFM